MLWCMKEKKLSFDVQKVTFVFLLIALIVMGYNQFQMFSMESGGQMMLIGTAVAQSSIIPTGTPRIYGSELDVNYDDVSVNNPGLADQTISSMGNLDRTITLQGQYLERYIDIVSEISCEYCCGATSIITRREDVEARDKQIETAIASGEITEDQADQYRTTAGGPACGCAHSYAMRGLAKYLITEHGDEFIDEEILEELAKWKTLYFPTQMEAKAQVLEENGIEFTYINLGSNKYRGIEKGATSGSGMVGGC